MDYNIMYHAAGIFLGGISGYLYYKFIGCKSGSCPLTSHPVSSAIFGAVMGYLITGNFI